MRSSLWESQRSGAQEALARALPTAGSSGPQGLGVAPVNLGVVKVRRGLALQLERTLQYHFNRGWMVYMVIVITEQSHDISKVPRLFETCICSRAAAPGPGAAAGGLHLSAMHPAHSKLAGFCGVVSDIPEFILEQET